MHESEDMTENLGANVEESPTPDSPYCGLKRIRLPNNETLELAILAWYNKQTSSGAKVRGVDIQEKASAIAKEMGEDNFVASSGWLWKFKIRNGIKITKRANNDKCDYGEKMNCGDCFMETTEADSQNGQVKRKRASLTVSQKLNILEELDNGSSPANICAKYGIARQTVSDIRKRKDKLRRFASDFNTSNMNERRSIYEACQDKPLDELLWIDGELVEVKVEENDDSTTKEGGAMPFEREDGNGALLDEKHEPCQAKRKQIILTEAQKQEIVKERETEMYYLSKGCDVAQSTVSEMSQQVGGLTMETAKNAHTREKRKRVSVTIAQKLEIIDKLESGISVAKICAEYGIKKQTVSDIKKSKSKIERKQYLSLQKEAHIVKRVSRSYRHEMIGEEVGKWYHQELECRGYVTDEEIRGKAELSARCLGLDDFLATEKWLQVFNHLHRPRGKLVKKKLISDKELPAEDSVNSESDLENEVCIKKECEYSDVNTIELLEHQISDGGNDLSVEVVSHPTTSRGRGKLSEIRNACGCDQLTCECDDIKKEYIKEEAQEECEYVDINNENAQECEYVDIKNENAQERECVDIIKEEAQETGGAEELPRNEVRVVQSRQIEELSDAEKLDITRKLESGISLGSICTEYHITENTVLGVKNLEEFCHNSSTSFYGMGRYEEFAQSDDSRLVDEAIYEWYTEEYRCRGHVNPHDILANAARLARTKRAKYFTASTKWLCHFKYRYNLGDEMLTLEEIDAARAPRVRLTVAQKVEILEKLDNGVSVTKVSAEYGVAKQTVSGIRKIRHKIEAFTGKNDNSSSESSAQCGRKVIRSPDALDEAVHKWYVKEQSKRGKVGGPELQETARRMAQKLGIENFSASSGWLWKFRVRHGLVNPRESSLMGHYSDKF